MRVGDRHAGSGFALQGVGIRRICMTDEVIRNLWFGQGPLQERSLLICTGTTGLVDPLEWRP